MMKINKIMKKVAGGVVAGAVILTVTGVSFAASPDDTYCYNATVTRVGVDRTLATAGATTAMYARFTCADEVTDGTRTWAVGTEKEFVFSEDVGNEAYATLLTTFVLGRDNPNPPTVRIGVVDLQWDSTLNLIDMFN